MRLDAGQVASIRERIRRLEERVANFDNISGLDSLKSFGSGGVTDQMLLEEFSHKYGSTKKELSDLKDMLLNSEYIIGEKELSTVDIGSEITIKFSDMDEEYSYILVEELIGKSSINNYISMESDFAKIERERKKL